MRDLCREVGQPLLLRADDNIARQPSGEIGGENHIWLSPIANCQIAQSFGCPALDQLVEEFLDLPNETGNNAEIFTVRGG